MRKTINVEAISKLNRENILFQTKLTYKNYRNSATHTFIIIAKYQKTSTPGRHLVPPRLEEQTLFFQGLNTLVCIPLCLRQGLFVTSELNHVVPQSPHGHVLVHCLRTKRQNVGLAQWDLLVDVWKGERGSEKWFYKIWEDWQSQWRNRRGWVSALILRAPSVKQIFGAPSP